MPYIETIRNMFTPFGGLARIGANSTGGTITTAGGYRIHTFTTVGTSTFTADNAGQVEVFLIGGGGSGGDTYAGGGGAGGAVYATSFSVAAGSSSVVVGAGGTSVDGTGAAKNGINGENSSAFGLIGLGGGKGLTQITQAATLGDGGCGGGACGNGTPGEGSDSALKFGVSTQASFSGATSYGFPGCRGTDSNVWYAAGGGGGIGGAGVVGTGGSAGSGGPGVAFSISGSSVTYGGGGGGGKYDGTSGSAGSGGSGIGGAGGYGAAAGGTAAANTGSGGGGTGGIGNGTFGSGVSGPGGSGIVIVRYPL